MHIQKYYSKLQSESCTRYRFIMNRVRVGKLPSNVKHRLFQAAKLYFPDIDEDMVEFHEMGERSVELTFVYPGNEKPKGFECQ